MNKSVKWLWLGGVLVLLGVFGAGVGLRPILLGGCEIHGPEPGTIRAKPGPWGVLAYTPIYISAPNEILPLRTMETQPIHWFFGGMSPADVHRTLSALGLSTEACDRLLPPAAITISPQGTQCIPIKAELQVLAPAIRGAIYQLLAHFPENGAEFKFIPTDKSIVLLNDRSVPSSTRDTIRQWSCGYGKYTLIYGFPCLLSAIPDPAEKTRLMKLVSRQDTYLLRLHITPETDINALKDYWGRAFWALDVSAFLQSLKEVSAGTWLDVIELLPPIPTALLYTYPLPQNPLNGPVRRHDCHWTTFNFFRDPADERYADPNFVLEKLRNDFYPIYSDPRYGDVILFSKPDGITIHSAIFLADNFVYSKNGDTPLNPWIITTLPELLDYYSFMVAPDQQLTVSYFRNKHY